MTVKASCGHETTIPAITRYLPRRDQLERIVHAARRPCATCQETMAQINLFGPPELRTDAQAGKLF